jgi:plastocyanin
MKTRLAITLVLFAALMAACAPQAVQPVNPTAVPQVNPTAVPQVQPTNVPQPTATAEPQGGPTAPAKGGAEVKVDISGFAFNPATITINVGDTITWTNQDSARHNVQADDGSWKSPDLSQGQSFSHTFTTAGTVPYNCGFHASMKATVVVK